MVLVVVTAVFVAAVAVAAGAVALYVVWCLKGVVPVMSVQVHRQSSVQAWSPKTC